MFHSLQVIAVILLAIALAPALAHALEFPGKKRLDRDAYLTVQRIYYPGFTIAGLAEVGGLLLSVVLLFLTPSGTAAFWLTCIAAIGMAGVQVVFWAVTQPINKVWVGGAEMGSLGSSFFEFSPAGHFGRSDAQDWRNLRDRWEYSHIARAILTFGSFVALLLATSIN
jgi:hypothetical protein